MNLTIQELEEKIAMLENEMQPFKSALKERLKEKGEETLFNIGLTYKKQYQFPLSELRFSRHMLCNCGAGLAYPLSIPIMDGAWHCSAILLGTASTKEPHDSKRPFAFHEIRSENEEFTTRPKITDAK